MDYPGAVHHVTMRGIERRAIFVDDVDRTAFVRRLEKTVLRSGSRCLAWALMPNHVHLLLETGPVPLPRAMARLGTGYAMDFNRRHERAGHLFQNRYHSKIVDAEGYLLQAVRYVHLNPVRARIVADLEALDRYPWTGHPTLLGLGTNRFQAVDPVLRVLHDDRSAARRILRAWMEAGLAAGVESRDKSSEEGGGEPGQVPVVERDETEAEVHGVGHDGPGAPGRWILARQLRLEGWDLPLLIRRVCEGLGVRAEDLLSGRRVRRVARARAAVGWLATERLGLPLSMTAPRLGVGPSSLCESLTRGREIVERHGLDIPAVEGGFPQTTESPRNVP